MTATLLIVDGEDDGYERVYNAPGMGVYAIERATNTSDAVQRLGAKPFDLVLVGSQQSEAHAFELTRYIKQLEVYRRIPVLLYGKDDTSELRKQALRAGADDFFPHLAIERKLAPRLRVLLRNKRLEDELHLRDTTDASLGITPSRIGPVTHARVLILTSSLDHPNIAPELINIDTRTSVSIASIETGWTNLLPSYDALLVDAEGQRPDTLAKQIGSIRAQWSLRDIAVLVVGNDELGNALAELELDGCHVMAAPVDIDEFNLRLSRLVERRHYTQTLRNTLYEHVRLSVIDPLTNLHNRRYFEHYFPKIQAQSQRSGAPVAIMVLDLDRFKSLNDAYGHDFGDFVLSEFAQRLRETMRAADLLTRFGGEEFVIVTPGADAKQAQRIAERIRQTILSQPFVASDGEEITVTVSIGITMMEYDDTADALVKRADAALYRAKALGRNRVEFDQVA